MTTKQASAGDGPSFGARVAGAPISWGVCEVPGWGHQLEPARVLGEMRAMGLTATEFGPVGFLEGDPGTRAQQLVSHGMVAVGGFLPVVLHDPDHDPLPNVDTFIDGCLVSGAKVVVLAASTGIEGYDTRPALDDAQWRVMLANLDRITDRAEARGVVACVHPHVGTMVETGQETERVLGGSRVGLCVDTGHLLVGGADPVALTARYPDRVVHVHLKDVDSRLASQVIGGKLSFSDAVRRGIFRPLGEGDVDIATLVRTLENSGYQGWYVLEQDVMLGAPPPEGKGPSQDVRKSLEYLLEVAR